jgi:hypothetical protein
MPAQQRLGCDRKARPGAPGKYATDGSKQRAIRGRRSRAVGLPAHDRQLVSEHQDLQLLRLTRSSEQRHERGQAADGEIDKRPEQAQTSK